jgi:LytS/YehU family sensor histidine kinase
VGGRRRQCRAAIAARATLLKAGKHRAEAAALRLQLNPHFLFNTLNSISSLVTLGRGREAEAMIDRLADFLRASLEADPMADVPLARELDTIDAYLGIEAARFGERLEIDIAVDERTMGRAGAPISSLSRWSKTRSKHGVAAQRGPATLRISAEAGAGELVLSVVNKSGEPEAAAEASAEAQPRRKGIGLTNIRQRLAMNYGHRRASKRHRFPTAMSPPSASPSPPSRTPSLE